MPPYLQISRNKVFSTGSAALGKPITRRMTEIRKGDRCDLLFSIGIGAAELDGFIVSDYVDGICESTTKINDCLLSS
jgi:hypothetical protein